jgi:carbonic anhydrase
MTTTEPTEEPTTSWPATPDEALRFLLDGNDRFVAGRAAHPNQDAERRTEAANHQNPFAVLFGCSDSRVAAEIIFDRGIGDLFVVRTAGHLIGEEVLASVDFAVAVLGTPLVVILSHDSCGAVGAALEAHQSAVTPAGHMRHIVERLTPEVLEARAAGITDRDEVVRMHGRRTAEDLLEQSALLRERVEAGTCGIVVLAYQLAAGRTHVIAAHGVSVPEHL